MLQRHRPHHRGQRPRRRREVRQLPAADLNVLETDKDRQSPRARSRAAPGREHRALHRHGHLRRSGARPGSDGHQRADLGRRSGEGTLGRIMNVIGEPVDEAGPIKMESRRAIHQPTPSYVEQSTEAQILVTGIKVVDLLAPYAKGGKIGLFGGAGVGKTVLDPGTDQQRRQDPRRQFGVRGRRRTHPRGQRPLSRIHRIEGQRRSP